MTKHSTDTNVNTAVIHQLTTALEASKKQLASVEAEYNRLKAEVQTYEQTIHRLRSLEDGDYAASAGASPKLSGEPPPPPSSLKDDVYTYFADRPGLSQSPKGLTTYLITKRGWSEDGLRVRVSNLLRKIISSDEEWLVKESHGRYTFRPPSR